VRGPTRRRQVSLALRVAQELLDRESGAVEEVEVHEIAYLGTSQERANLVRDDLLDGVGQHPVAPHLGMELKHAFPDQIHDHSVGSGT